MSSTVKRYTQPETIPFEYEPVDGTVLNYRLVTLTGEERDNYLASVKQRMTKNVKGESEVTNIKGLTASILLYSLQKEVGGNWEKVPEKEIQAFPAPMQSELSAEALKLSGLNKEAAEEAKKG